MSIIGREEALNLLQTHGLKISSIEEIGIINDLENQKLDADLNGEERIDIIVMRKQWSRWILFAILLIIISDIIFVSLIGLRVFKFDNNNWIVPAFIGDSLVKTLGLAAIIVNFLFDRKRKIGN